MARLKENVHIRVDAEQKQMLMDLANEYGKTMTDFIIMMAEHVRDTRPTFQVKPQRKRKSKEE